MKHETAPVQRGVLITGGAGGLGSALALRLTDEGYRVAINFRGGGAAAERLTRKLGASALALRADVGDPGEMYAAAEALRAGWGRLEALINCAGIARDALLVKLEPEEWDEVIRVNLTGAFNAIRSFAPLMTGPGGGHIINVSSYSGLKGKRGQAAYSASKAALIGLTLGAAAELGGRNIRVNAVLPGYMPTRMGAAAPGAMREAEKDSLLGRLSGAEEAASFIAGLLRMECITGQVYPVESRAF
ncbi:MAG: SDR family NAD(P)-dependent oxidoreductase [Nitrospiraceae bacterium]|nr:SDR family NAD(P)-dependent oxidoreductase [Nitrospiraceae bacterium]